MLLKIRRTRSRSCGTHFHLDAISHQRSCAVRFHLSLQLWPAFWTMGNLGRAAHGGSLDGMWPYSYDSCDVGTLANQTLNGEPALVAASGGGPNNELSFLPGQRLSRCTCPDDPTHPGPKHADGTWVGRSAPEIDVFEAQVDPITREGHVSLSAQWARTSFISLACHRLLSRACP